MIVELKGLRLPTVIGAYEWERATAQEVLVDVTLSYDTARAVLSDSLDDAVDYDALAGRIAAHLKEAHCVLIETLAHRLVTLILDDVRIDWARVTIHKPGAVKAAASVSVTCEGKREL